MNGGAELATNRRLNTAHEGTAPMVIAERVLTTWGEITPRGAALLLLFVVRAERYWAWRSPDWGTGFRFKLACVLGVVYGAMWLRFPRPFSAVADALLAWVPW